MSLSSVGVFSGYGRQSWRSQDVLRPLSSKLYDFGVLLFSRRITSNPRLSRLELGSGTSVEICWCEVGLGVNLRAPLYPHQIDERIKLGVPPLYNTVISSSATSLWCQIWSSDGRRLIYFFDSKTAPGSSTVDDGGNFTQVRGKGWSSLADDRFVNFSVARFLFGIFAACCCFVSSW